MSNQEKPSESAKRDQILRCGNRHADMVRARAKAKGIGIYQAAEELIEIGQKRVDALATHAQRKKAGEV